MIEHVAEIHDRYIEVPDTSPREREQSEQGWILIKDRATGKVILANANTRTAALWLMRALNAADRSVDRLAEEDAA